MRNYTKRFTEEMSFFIHPVTGNVTYNPKCKSCIHECKQSFRAKIISCKQYAKKEDAVSYVKNNK